MRIAMIGQRGVPATFGGVEHHVEELGSRLAERGHDVTVYTRTNYTSDRMTRYRGMRPRYLPTVDSKHLDAIVHSSLSTVDAMLSHTDVVHYHAVGPGLPAVLPRYLSHAKVVLTVHGLDAERAKWSGTARAVLRIAQWMSARVPDATIVVSRDLGDHFRRRYGRTTAYIPNGVDRPTRRPADRIGGLGLRGGEYLLFVGRLVPEKAPDLLLRAFAQVPGATKLVLAGGSSHTDDYVRGLRSQAAADPRVVLPGYVYGDLLEELYSNAAAFVLPSLLEGLPLTLLEAASYGIPIVASDIPPHVEIIGSDGPGRRLVTAGDADHLAQAIGAVLDSRDEERTAAEAFARAVLAEYRWDEVVDATEAVYRSVTSTAGPPPSAESP
jgi:glycosyltransferase involved in cell wall biosynthesis